MKKTLDSFEVIFVSGVIGFFDIIILFELRITRILTKIYKNILTITQKKGAVMRKDIKLYVPKLDEMEYRQIFLLQPGTMDYNKGYEINHENYHKDTGCIDFPKSQWESWYHLWVNNKPNCFYAYIKRTEDSQFMGEVNIHYNQECEWYEMGIVIEEKYRGKGYSTDALRLLLKVAFEEYNANGVHNNFEYSKHTAIKAHIDSGFRIIDHNEGNVDVYISRTQYFDHISRSA